MEKPKKSNLPSHYRRPGSISRDVKKSSSSLNMSTSSLPSINEDVQDTAARRPAVVRFAPPPTARRSSIPASQQEPPKAAASAAARRPASSCGQRPSRPSAAARSLPLPEYSGPKALRRSWGWTGSAGDHMEETENGDLRSEGTAARSVPIRMAEEEKPLQRRESKDKITSRTKSRSSNPSPKQNVPLKPSSAQRSPSIAGKSSEKDPPSSTVSLDNMVRVPPPSKTSSSTTPGASWESLPSDLKNLGSEVMSYKDAAEMAAVEAMQEASAAEIVLRCLSAFADLTASAAKQPPQHTVDEFLALQAAITRSAAVLGNHQQHRHGSGGQASDWLRAAVTADLAPFSLYRKKKQQSAEDEPPAASFPSASPLAAGEEAAAAAAEEEEEEEMEITWLEAAARRLGEEMSAWFAGHVEGLVDGDVAGTLGQLKRVNDWLDKEDAGPRRSEAGERLRKKIFRYLLDHVESAVVALNGGAAPNRGKSNRSVYSVP